MKKLLLALSLAALGAACRSSGANVHDTSTCTGADCADCAANCTKEEMANCHGDKAEECKAEAGAVCPVTGKSMN